MKFLHSLLTLAVIIGLGSTFVEDIRNPPNLYLLTSGTGVPVDPSTVSFYVPNCKDKKVQKYQKEYYCKLSQTKALKFYNNPYQ